MQTRIRWKQQQISDKIHFIKKRTECGDLQLSLKEETVKQLKKLLGVDSAPSPTSVTQGSTLEQPDEYKDLINALVTYFITKVTNFMLIHVQFVCGLEIW